MRRIGTHALVVTLGLAGCLPVSGDDGGVLDGGPSADAGADRGPADAGPDRGGRDGATDRGPPDAAAADGGDALAPGDGGRDAAADVGGDGAADAAPDAGCVPLPEACDDLDNDCDGATDEGVCLAAGALDPTFATGGVFLEALGVSAEARDVAVDAQGRVLLGGSVDEALGGWNMLATRLTPAGAFDPAYAERGWASVDFAGDADQAFALDVDPDGGTVLAGFRTDGTANPALAKLTAAGVLDPAFSGGRVSPPGLQSGAYRKVELLPAGLVAFGSTRAVGATTTELVTRHTADGALEGGPEGLVSLEHGTDVQVRAATLLPDGTLAFAGHLEAGADDDGFLAVLRPDGSVDLQLVDVTALDTRERFLGLVAVANGYLLVGESAGDLLVERLDAVGRPDAAFGNNGRVLLDLGGGRDQGADAVVQPDGAILIAGSSEVVGIARFMVLRLTAAGALDPTFGSGGQVLLDFGTPDEDSEAHALALDPTGTRVVAVGAAGPHGARRLVVVRLGR